MVTSLKELVLRKGFFFTFFAVWLGGCSLALFALLELFVWHSAYGVALLAAYYSYRYLVPKKRWPFVREMYISWCTNYPYFKTQKLVFAADTGAMKPDSKSLICCHPHGVLCCGWTMMANHEALSASKFQWLVAESLVFMPFVSDVMTWTSGGPATKKNMISSMKTNENLALLPGGFEESTIFHKGKHRVFIKHRKGFIKYALQHGYTLYPTYVFGEEDTYRTLNGALPARLWLNKYKLPAVLFYGLWYCFFMPFPQLDLVCVIGPAMPLPLISEPTEQQISTYHAQYIQALTHVFDSHKTQFAKDPTAVLEIY